MGDEELEDKVSIMPCPFKHIKQEIEIQQFDTGDTFVFAVTCKVCGTVGPMGESPEYAMYLWNLRDIIVVPQDKYNEYVEESNAKEQEIISAHQEGSRKDGKESAKKKQDNAENS